MPGESLCIGWTDWARRTHIQFLVRVERNLLFYGVTPAKCLPVAAVNRKAYWATCRSWESIFIEVPIILITCRWPIVYLKMGSRTWCQENSPPDLGAFMIIFELRKYFCFANQDFAYLRWYTWKKGCWLCGSRQWWNMTWGDPSGLKKYGRGTWSPPSRRRKVSTIRRHRVIRPQVSSPVYW